MSHIRFLLLIGVFVAPVAMGAQKPEAPKAITAAREALGGEAKLAAIKAFTATGQRIRSVSGVQVQDDFSLACELPDKYVRTSRIAFGRGEMAFKTGFNGDGLIGEMLDGGGMGNSSSPEQGAAVNQRALLTAKQEFLHFTLGMFAASFSGYELKFSDAGSGDAPGGKADLLDVKGPGGFEARFFVSQQTHLPRLLSWRAPETRPVQSGGGAVMTESAPVEHRLAFDDYRGVDGVKLPFRLIETVDGRVVEDTTITAYVLNPRIDAKTFSVSR